MKAIRQRMCKTRSVQFKHEEDLGCVLVHFVEADDVWVLDVREEIYLFAHGLHILLHSGATPISLQSTCKRAAVSGANVPLVLPAWIHT